MTHKKKPGIIFTIELQISLTVLSKMKPQNLVMGLLYLKIQVDHLKEKYIAFGF